MDINCIYIYFLIFIILLALLGIFNNSDTIDVYNSNDIYSIKSKNLDTMSSISTASMSGSKDISFPMHY